MLYNPAVDRAGVHVAHGASFPLAIRRGAPQALRQQIHTEHPNETSSICVFHRSLESLIPCILLNDLVVRSSPE